MLDLIWLIPALPLAGFVLILLFGRILGEPKSGILAASMVGASFAVTVAVFFELLSRTSSRFHGILVGADRIIAGRLSVLG
jgi:NADH-quinone oxidoreductase subunit L